MDDVVHQHKTTGDKKQVLDEPEIIKRYINTGTNDWRFLLGSWRWSSRELSGLARVICEWWARCITEATGLQEITGTHQHPKVRGVNHLLTSRLQRRESTCPGVRDLPGLKCVGALQAHSCSKWSRPSSRGTEAHRAWVAHAKWQSHLWVAGGHPWAAVRGTLHLAHSEECPSPGPVASQAFRLVKRTMGPGSCLCPVRAALPVPLGPPLAPVPCPSPFQEPRGAGAPGGAGSWRRPSPGSVSAEAAEAPGRGTGCLKRSPLGALDWPGPVLGWAEDLA